MTARAVRRSALAFAALAAACRAPAPLVEFPQTTPEAAGLSRARLEALARDLSHRETGALVVVRDGALAFEWYAEGFGGPARRHYTASLAKAIVGGVALAIAVGDGRIALDDPASRWIEAWRADPLRSRITIRQLAGYASGIANASRRSRGPLAEWEGAFWAQGENPFRVAIERAPLAAEPGTHMLYSNPGIAALGYALTASLRGAPEPDVRTLLRVRVMEPLEVPSGAWEMGYGREERWDGLALHAIWGGGRYTPRAVARVGELVAGRGEWRGRRLVRAEALDDVLSTRGLPPPDRSSGDPIPAAAGGFFTNADGVWPAIPRDAVVGLGAGAQLLAVIPSLGIVAVRMGRDFPPEEPHLGEWASIERHLLRPLVESVRGGVMAPRRQEGPDADPAAR